MGDLPFGLSPGERNRLEAQTYLKNCFSYAHFDQAVSPEGVKSHVTKNRRMIS
jgi:hypothetical protein